MKHKISAFFLSIALCLSCLCVCTAPAQAASSIADFYDVISRFRDIINSIVERNEDFNEWKSFNATTPEGFKARSIVLAKFKPLKEYLPDASSKNEFLHILTLFVNTDNAAVINEEYGHDAELLYREHNLEFNDFYVDCIIPLFVGLEDFVNALYETDLTDYSVDDKGNVQIPIEDFKQELEKQNNTIDPKNRSMVKYSWRDLSNNQDNPDWTCFARNVVEDCKTCVGSSLMEDGMYIQLYMRRNGYMYYLPYQYHMYADVENVFNESNLVTASKYNVYIDPIYYETVNGESLDTFQYKAFTWDNFYNNSTSGNVYFSLGWTTPVGYNIQGFRICTYDSLGNCLKNLTPTHQFWFPELCETGSTSSSGITSSIYRSEHNYFLRSDNVDKKINLEDGIEHFFRSSDTNHAMFTNLPISSHDTGLYPSCHSHFADQKIKYIVTCNEESTCDFGFLISSEQFTTTYQFDTTRLPVNSTVTISGDSVYDYSITDNSTGESSTIYNYVTNNYTYPESSGGNTSGGNGGGTVGGNITVGGQVDVGGKVDLNVNVNGNGNGVSADMPDMNAVDDYLNNALDESTGIRKFLKEFFGFLPADLVVLLGIGLAAAIVARIFGR